jgi:hypothetical protein
VVEEAVRGVAVDVLLSGLVGALLVFVLGIVREWWRNEREWRGLLRLLLAEIKHNAEIVERTRYTEKPREEWIAVPVPDAGIPKELVERARAAIENNERCSSAGRRFWELSGGIFRCAECGRALVATTASKGP